MKKPTQDAMFGHMTPNEYAAQEIIIILTDHIHEWFGTSTKPKSEESLGEWTADHHYFITPPKKHQRALFREMVRVHNLVAEKAGFDDWQGISDVPLKMSKDWEESLADAIANDPYQGGDPMPGTYHWKLLTTQFTELPKDVRDQFKEASYLLAEEVIYMDGEATPEEAKQNRTRAEANWYRLCKKHDIVCHAVDHEAVYREKF
jgi:hypothetical protein